MSTFIAIRSLDGTSANSKATTAIIVLASLIVSALVITVTVLLVLRARRRRSEPLLPLHSASTASFMPRKFSRSRASSLTSIFVQKERQALLDDSAPPPSTAIPEIRLTFPDEHDEISEKQAGPVVVIHVGDQGLPSYKQEDAERYESLDLDRIGGLKA